MKKLILILTVGFLLAFSGTSQAYWGRWGWHRCWAPRPVVVIGHPCYHPIWYPGYWAWDRWHHRVWIRGYWR